MSALGIVMAAMSCPLEAQDEVLPRLWSVDISPQVGYRSSMSFRVEPETEGINPRVSVNAGRSFGVGVGIRYNDEDVVEFRWARQDTHLRITDPVVGFVRDRVVLDQFHMDCSHEYVVEGWPTWARPFIIGSVGVTHISSTSTSVGFTRFSFGIGGGVKAFVSPHLGFKLQAQWLPLWIEPEVQALCSAGCILHLSGQLASQGEITIGPVFRF